MVPKDGSSLKETNTAHGVRRVEERKRKLREGERRRAGRREAKPRESVANQALRPPPFLHPTLRPTPRDSPPPSTSARHVIPQYFLQAELDGAMSIDSLYHGESITTLTLRGSMCFLFSTLGMSSTPKGNCCCLHRVHVWRVVASFRACEYSCYKWYKAQTTPPASRPNRWFWLGEGASLQPNGRHDQSRPLDMAWKFGFQEFQGPEPGTPTSRGRWPTLCLHVDLQGRSSMDLLFGRPRPPLCSPVQSCRPSSGLRERLATWLHTLRPNHSTQPFIACLLSGKALSNKFCMLSWRHYII